MTAVTGLAFCRGIPPSEVSMFVVCLARLTLATNLDNLDSNPSPLVLFDSFTFISAMPTAMKRKSPEITGADDVATPTGSPTKKMRMTQSQKQALMDNLQLESA
jgi:hypothetical protein